MDMILAIGYRVNSKNASLFRQWATQILKRFIFRASYIPGNDEIFRRLTEHDIKLHQIESRIDLFIQNALPPTEGIFFNGQVFDAYVFVNDLIRSASQRILLIDNYIDDSVLKMLDKRGKGVNASIYTQRISPQLQQDIEKHNTQYPTIEVQTISDVHDRFLIIDDILYHIGASIKDLGKKLFAFTRMEMPAEELMRVFINT